MANPDLQRLIGHPTFGPVFAYVATECGVIKRHSPLDAQARIDPCELAGQKALRDFALKFFEDCGWDFRLQPPAREATPRQQQAETDGGTLAEA